MMVHLCATHRNEWDASGEDAILGRMDANRAMAEEERPQCIESDCNAVLVCSGFQLCVHCAEKGRKCQQCLASTLTPEEIEETRRAVRMEEAYQDAVDLYTLAVKAFGISATRRLFLQKLQWPPEFMNRVLRLGHTDIDYNRELRPIWREVLGANVYRDRRCAKCEPPPRNDPALTIARQCGHVTVGRSATWCPVCAARASACESCGGDVG